MTASSAQLVLDPLSEQEAISSDTAAAVATARRSERVAPAVTAMHGAEAVAIVRAAGFIAAIEPVSSDLPEGTVIEQEPSAGARLSREGVITLRLATPLLEAARAAMEDQGRPAFERAAATADPDDTEEWFQALALGTRDARRGGASGRRSRKHRPRRLSAHELSIDPKPTPSPQPSQSAGAITLLKPTQDRARVRALITSASFALAPSRAGLTWRRAGALVAGLLLLALLGTRPFGSSQRRVRSSDHHEIGPSPHTTGPAHRSLTASEPPARPHVRSAHRRRAGRSPQPDANHPARPRTGYEAHARTLVASPAVAPQTAAAPSNAAVHSASAQFAYLGQ